MKTYNFEPAGLAELSELVQAYVASLSSPIDSFLEEHILASQPYRILAGDGVIGYCAIHVQKLLTQFYIRPRYLAQGQAVFAEIIARFQVESALVPTCDELFLSHALDRESSIEFQAYFFVDRPEIEVGRRLVERGHFRVAIEKDAPAIERVAIDFFDRLAERIARQEIFVLVDGDTLLGVGIIEPGRLLTGCTSIGMFTVERFRRRGLGRSILVNLKRWCYARGQLPLAGCWYYNHASKKTLESAGMVSRTRLLRIHLTRNETAGSK